MKDENEQFIFEQAKSESGKRWLEVFYDIIDELYNSKGKSAEQIQTDQRAAEKLEEVASGLEVAKQEKHPDNNQEYR